MLAFPLFIHLHICKCFQIYLKDIRQYFKIYGLQVPSRVQQVALSFCRLSNIISTIIWCGWAWYQKRNMSRNLKVLLSLVGKGKNKHSFIECMTVHLSSWLHDKTAKKTLQVYFTTLSFMGKGKAGCMSYNCMWLRCSSPTCWPFELELVAVKNPLPWDTRQVCIISGVPQFTFLKFSKLPIYQPTWKREWIADALTAWVRIQAWAHGFIDKCANHFTMEASFLLT